MLNEAARHLNGKTSLETIYFVLFDTDAKNIFEQMWERIRAEAAGKADKGASGG